MLKRIHLQNFKNFQDAELHLGNLSVLVGTNASGKSNIRDAFRFLHGISRGYQIAEIIGGKYVEGGVLQWRGIRGGTKEIAFYDSQRFAIAVEIVTSDPNPHSSATWSAGEELIFIYRCEISISAEDLVPRIYSESLVCDHLEHPVFEATSTDIIIPDISYLTDFPSRTLFFLLTAPEVLPAQIALHALSNMRFFDFSPDAMRQPSFPGQTILGDRGENLSSVLQDIYSDPERKQTLLSWLQELTPMDVKDFEFPSDPIGQIWLILVEENGQRTSAYSASDGTLRFLGMLAALLGKDSSNFYFFEEPENGIHPTRLYLLLQLLEQEVARSQKQVVITTHSPILLHYLSRENWDFASLIYRLPQHTESRIARILDLPDAQRIAEDKTLGRLHESGWLENATYFLADEEKES